MIIRSYKLALLNLYLSDIKQPKREHTVVFVGVSVMTS